MNNQDSENQARLPKWVPILAALVVGLCLGAFMMQQRLRHQNIVAAVNGTIISQGALFDRLQAASGPAVMHKMVEEELQLQFAKKMGFSPTEAQVDTQVASDSKQAGFQQILAAHLVSPDDYRRLVRIRLAQETAITHGVSVSDAEARRYYSAQIDSRNPRSLFFRPETVTLQVIATPTQRGIHNAVLSLAVSTPFDLVAGAYSKDASKDNGGLLAPLQRGRSLFSQNPALEQTLFNLKVGQQFGPTFYKGRWWLFRCQDKQPGGVIPYAQVAAQCRRGARLQKGLVLNTAKIQTQFAAFQQSANIQAFWKQYTPAVHGL